MTKRKKSPRTTSPFSSLKPSSTFKTRVGKNTLAAVRKIRVPAKSKKNRFWDKPKPIKVSDLQVGDLAFSRFRTNPGTIISSAITGYPSMHVSLYLGKGKFFDLGERARIVLSETLSNYYPEPFVFRPKLSGEQKEKIALLAKAMAKKKTRHGKRARLIVGAQRTVGINVKNPKNVGYLCSTPIAEFFEKAGANLVPKVHPLRVSPTDLMKSKKLELING